MGHGEESTWLRILDGCSFILYPTFDPSFDLNLNFDPLNLAVSVLFLKSGPDWISKYAAVHMEENPNG